MIHWTNDDAQMLAHVVSEMNEHVMYDGDFTDGDRATMVKLEELAKAGAAVTVNASQRLLFRAGAALGVKQPDPSRVRADCGAARADHATVPDWVSTLYVHRCINCARLFRA